MAVCLWTEFILLAHKHEHFSFVDVAQQNSHSLKLTDVGICTTSRDSNKDGTGGAKLGHDVVPNTSSGSGFCAYIPHESFSPLVLNKAGEATLLKMSAKRTDL